MAGWRCRAYQCGCAAAGLALIVVVAACSRSSDAPRPSVMLISIDTLRADRLGTYGAATNYAPTLDRLATQAVVYERAYSASSWTLPSHRSLLTGRYPAELRAASPSVAELFRDAGYATGGFTGGGVVSKNWGFDRGFDTFYAYEHASAPTELCPPTRFDAAEVFARARAWLRDNGKRPFFFFLHTYEVHDRCEFLTRSPVLPLPDPGQAGRQEISDYYGTLISRVDHLMAGLLDDLEATGRAADTIVAITSDHGEGFWEHGGFGHGCELTPYEEIVHVPLVLRYPARFPKPLRVAERVSNIAIVPTVLELAGLPVPAALRGRALPGLGLPDAQPSTPVFSDCAKYLTVWSDRYKLIQVRGRAPAEELYDLVADPQERDNLADRNPPWAAQLRQYAATYAAPAASANATPGLDPTKPVVEKLDEKTRERLRALGYLPDQPR